MGTQADIQQMIHARLRKMKQIKKSVYLSKVRLPLLHRGTSKKGLASLFASLNVHAVLFKPTGGHRERDPGQRSGLRHADKRHRAAAGRAGR